MGNVDGNKNTFRDINLGTQTRIRTRFATVSCIVNSQGSLRFGIFGDDEVWDDPDERDGRNDEEGDGGMQVGERDG